ncbi:SMP-30/gluconolactonase/LRE family protein [Sphingobium subterraneum]|uniref:Gluconolactonase n=1 Tax=Sphingobium subterraneum TaxID=627688 RepID=A0A841IWU4_9SPHN|nr:SMP-30/gluconolactonase/LRE family protein [Sphingobium subterraneum]MBB6123409.1 gluconolactonase [Sphingobium subterraneum]
MSAPVSMVEAQLFSRLPEALHYKGSPNAWVQMTRPGQRLHSFLEGPAFDRDGVLWLADVPYGRIFTVSPQGEWTLALEYDGEPHGLAFDGSGDLLIADYRNGLLTWNGGPNPPETLVTKADGAPLQGIADLVVADDGTVWLTEPGRSSLSNPYGRLLKVDAGASEAVTVLANLPYPNSVALSPDGRLLYLSLTRSNTIWRLMTQGPETPPMAGVHIQLSGGLGPDGLAVHPRGLLAAAQAQAGRAYVFDSLGDKVAHIATPGGTWTTAVRFSQDGRQLFIVEAQSGSIYSADIASLLPQTDTTERPL